MSDEFRVMNSLDDLIHVRIDHWKLFAGHVLVDDTRLRQRGREARGSYPERAGIRPTHPSKQCFVGPALAPHR